VSIRESLRVVGVGARYCERQAIRAMGVKSGGGGGIDKEGNTV
jgi:hypothetical protein